MATMMLSEAVSLAAVSQRLNHARISTTVNVYAHASRMGPSRREALAGLLKRGRGRVERRATATGRDRDEVIEDALRRQLENEGFQDALAKVRERSDLSDEQALELAYGELEAMRAEHRGAS